MKPNGGGTKLPGRLEKKITEDLGGLEKFKTDFAAAGVGQFGSGWGVVSVKNGKLEISKTPTAKTRWCMAPRRSSASMSGSIPITSIIATAVRTTQGVCRSSGELEYVDQLFSKA